MCTGFTDVHREQRMITDITPPDTIAGGSCAADWSQGPVLGGSDLIALTAYPDNLREDQKSTDFEELYLVDPATRESIKLTDTPLTEGYMAWSPDGTRLAVLRTDWNDLRRTLWIIDLVRNEGKIEIEHDREILSSIGSFRSLSWANNRDTLLLSLSTTFNDPGDLYMLDVGYSSVLRQITGGPNQPNPGSESWGTWSPQDDQIAFYVNKTKKVKDRGIYIMDVSSGEIRQIIRSGGGFLPKFKPDWLPTWRADTP